MGDITNRINCALGNHNYRRVRDVAFRDHEGCRYYKYQDICRRCSHRRPVKYKGRKTDWEFEDLHKHNDGKPRRAWRISWGWGWFWFCTWMIATLLRYVF